MLLGERGANGNYRIGGTVSAGLGGSRLLPTRDGGWFALTLIRGEDHDLLPALFQDAAIDPADDEAIARAVAQHDCADLVARGRVLGLPVASADEAPVSSPVAVLTRGPGRGRRPAGIPLVVDLSAIWAGPLIGNLLWLAGAHVVKVESLRRPDLIRGDDPDTFGCLNQGKESVVVDFASDAEKLNLINLIRRADIVIESSRPRALRNLEIDAEALVREVPGLVWLSVTGHGATGEAADWTGIGNDCGVAGGLTRALAETSGKPGFVGDAIADPLTGITGAIEAWRAYRAGDSCRIGLAMSAITARALAEECAHDPDAITAELRAWGAAIGRPFPAVPRREMLAPVRDFGADTAAWLSC
ncbi:MAG: CoA transferase [Novosphingobium sp.]